MIYTQKYPSGHMKVDTDKIANLYTNSNQLFVHFFSKEDRIKLIEFLESEGFSCGESKSFSRQSIMDSGFPLVIERDEKSIRCMGNVTCAAAAASSGIIMSDKDFYLLYSLQSQM